VLQQRSETRREEKRREEKLTNFHLIILTVILSFFELLALISSGVSH